MTSREYKKVILAALLVVLAFIIGVLIGYFSRRVWIKVDHRTALFDKLNREGDEGITHKLFGLISREQLDYTLRELVKHPRLAGTKQNKESGYFVHQTFLKYGIESELSEYNVTLSYPEDKTENFVSIIREDGVEVFRTSVSVEKDEVPPYNAFSPSGIAQGELVFVNYARKSDFQWLEENGINVSGRVVIAKYGKGFRGNKVSNAHAAGAKGIILYSDPVDYAPYSNVSGIYPQSIFLPDDGAQRGNIVINKGDQSTPGYPANEYAYRLMPEELKERLPQIPCLPISYRNAANILRLMTGNIVPDKWKGGLNITYRLGPSLVNSSKVVLQVKNRLEYTKIYNVIGRITGDIEPDRYVILGNHRDAWVYGSVDPTSGSIVLLETARIFGHLLKTGWRPRRTVLFCNWDAEEFGLVGSYEWVEDNLKWLFPNAVAYINIDSSVSGNETINLKTVPLIQTVFEDASKKIADPHGKHSNVFEAWTKHPAYGIDKIGGGSDHVPFIAGIGIPSIYAKYSYLKDVWKGTVSPLYHSRYENYHAYKMIDPDMTFTATMTGIVSEMTRNLADSRVIPFNITTYADYLLREIKEFVDTYSLLFPDKLVDYLQKSGNMFLEASTKFMASLGTLDRNNPLMIRQINDRMMSLERAFLINEGLPGKEAFKHVLHSPGTVDYYAGVAFPGMGGIHQCAESANKTTCFPVFQKHLTVIIHCINAAAAILKQ